MVGTDTFSGPTPVGVLFRYFGFTIENMVNTTKSVIA